MRAAISGHAGIVQALLDAGADQDLKDSGPLPVDQAPMRCSLWGSKSRALDMSTISFMF
jgi:hypothetical protein